MTKFEIQLINKGYIKHRLNCKTMKYEVANNHEISTMGNLDHRYIHKTDDVILKKIEQGISVMDDKFTLDDRKDVICFGFNEANKPPTLIYPRPKIIVKRERDYNGEKQIVFENENFDDSMNVVLINEESGEILKSLFDSSIIFKYDLTD